MNSPYMSRKFILTIASMIVTGVLVWFEKIDSGGFVTVYIATVGAYIAGNVYQNTKVTK